MTTWLQSPVPHKQLTVEQSPRYGSSCFICLVLATCLDCIKKPRGVRWPIPSRFVWEPSVMFPQWQNCLATHFSECPIVQWHMTVYLTAIKEKKKRQCFKTFANPLVIKSGIFFSDSINLKWKSGCKLSCTLSVLGKDRIYCTSIYRVV